MAEEGTLEDMCASPIGKTLSRYVNAGGRCLVATSVLFQSEGIGIRLFPTDLASCE